MILSELLDGLKGNYTVTGADGLPTGKDPDITAVVNDSRKLTKGCLFLCIKGANFDGHSAALEAAEAGAAAIVIQDDVTLTDAPDTVLVRVSDTRYAMALISAAWFGYPARKLKTIGITGTKGKTTTTFLVRGMLENAGIKTGLIGTIEYITGSEHIHASNTTPESYTLQELFARMVENGCEAVVMEVSSQALMLHRTAGIDFDLGIFTNLEPDHIGEHEHADFEDYMHCKSLLFRQCKCGIVNGDDAHCKDVTKGHTCTLETYGFDEGNYLRALNLAYIRKAGALGVFFDTEGLINVHAEIANPGKFSVYNALCAIAVARHFGCTPETIAEALKGARVKGRIEMVPVS
ncbi:MAG: UDP-N-acetylmuramoyl-L-alanyl-D-glutamate--2,6-diaminopimelate ligase, partial [Lachnospiraceae bacterium]|nr:UDP-N-acetylmuramoyl-L-alanyl-D-glutamate--2,6-diaminopimelate ligase [Lachnospiraceae bacterium]